MAERLKYDLFVSELVIQEAEIGDATIARSRLADRRTTDPFSTVICTPQELGER
jgi:hypothetical protein